MISSASSKALNPLQTALLDNDHGKAMALISQSTPEMLQTPVMVPESEVYGFTPLHLAAAKNNLVIVQRLVEEYKMDPFALVQEGRDKGFNSLHTAIYHKKSEVAKYLIDQCTPESFQYLIIAPKKPFHCCTYLYLAVISGNLSLTQYLVEKYKEYKLDPFILMQGGDAAGYNVLHAAIGTKQTEVAKYLIDQCTPESLQRPTIREKRIGYTPLGMVITDGNFPLVKYFVEKYKEYQLDPFAPLQVGYAKVTPLTIAEKSKQEEIKKYFLELQSVEYLSRLTARQKEPEKKPEKKAELVFVSPKQLHLACQKGVMSIVTRYVSEQRKRPTTKSLSTNVLAEALYIACREEKIPVVNYLVDEVNWQKTDINHRFEGNTILTIALQKNNKEMTTKLLSVKNLVLPSEPTISSSQDFVIKPGGESKEIATPVPTESTEETEKRNQLLKTYAENKKEIELLRKAMSTLQPHIQAIPASSRKDFKEYDEVNDYLQKLDVYEREIASLTTPSSEWRKSFLACLKKLNHHLVNISNLWKKTTEFFITQEPVDRPAKNVEAPKTKTIPAKVSAYSSSSSSHFRLPAKVESDAATEFKTKVDQLSASLESKSADTNLVARAIRLDILRRLLIQFLQKMIHIEGYRTLRNGLVHCKGVPGMHLLETLDETTEETEEFKSFETQLFALSNRLVESSEPASQLPLYVELRNAAGREEKFTLEEQIEMDERAKTKLALYQRTIITLPEKHILRRYFHLAESMINIRASIASPDSRSFDHGKARRDRHRRI